jgi:hypothetical protein
MLGNKIKPKEGVPQGGVISPVLFLVFIDDITNSIPTSVGNSLHADDLAGWSTTVNLPVSIKHVQETINGVKKWTDDWGQELSKTKTCFTLFTLSSMKEEIELSLGDDPIPRAETPVFLGGKYDPRLTWNAHIEATKTKALKKMNLMKKLAGTY